VARAVGRKLVAKGATLLDRMLGEVSTEIYLEVGE